LPQRGIAVPRSDTLDAVTAPGFSDLRLFLDALHREGELCEIDAVVDPYLEAAEIHRRVIAAGGPALLFRRVEGSDFPLVTNLFGTRRRAQLAFGRRPRRLIERMVETLQGALPPSMGDLWRARDLGMAALKLGSRRVRRGAVIDVVSTDVDLGRLPAITSWPQDGGPFLTLPLVYTEHPEDGRHNLGIYRMQVHDRNLAGMHWQIGKGGGFHYAAAERVARELPVTVFLGGPPALILAAVAPLPENVPELLLASLILGSRIRMCPGPGVHRLVADAEFALVGRVVPGVRRPEGPFGDHYGYYSLQHDYPVLQIDAVAHRRDAIYPATVVGKPRQEDFFIGDLLQELLEPLFPVVMPTVKKIWSYGETGYHALAGAVVRERYRREAMVSAFRILGEGQLSLTKFLLVTDRDVDLRDFPATLRHVLERTHPETDLYVVANLSMDTLDYTGPEVNLGSKGIWLGLGDPVRELPAEYSSSTIPSGVTDIRVFCPGCLVVGGAGYGDDPGLPDRITADAAFRDWPLVVLSDEPRRAASSSVNFLWTTFTRFEPAADIHASDVVIDRQHVRYRFPIVIDARIKPPYPNELFCDETIARRVTERWAEYFPNGGVEMGDSDRAHLDPP